MFLFPLSEKICFKLWTDFFLLITDQERKNPFGFIWWENWPNLSPINIPFSLLLKAKNVFFRFLCQKWLTLLYENDSNFYFLFFVRNQEMHFKCHPKSRHLFIILPWKNLKLSKLPSIISFSFETFSKCIRIFTI